MSTLCRHCMHDNAPQARFCAQCGQPLADAERSNAEIPKPFAEAARAIDDLAQHPTVQEASRKAGLVMQQVGAEIDRLSKSEEVKRARQQVGEATDKAVQTVKEQVAGVRRVEPSSAASPAPARKRPCLRCGASNRSVGRFCATCGEPFDVAPASLQYTVAHASDVGQKRSNNEDTVRVWSYAPYGLSAWALLVADGMGGAASGEIASKLVAEVVEQEIANRRNASNPKPSDLERWLRVIVRQANSMVYRQAQANPAQQGMGSTMTLAWLEEDHVTIAQAGDSRAYLIPPAGPFWQITQDHTMVALLVSIGELTLEQAIADPQNSLLYRSVGIAPQIEVDTFVRRVAAGDRLLLCCDGLYRHVPPDELATVARQHADPATACRNLIDLANQRGGEDNISVIVALAQTAPMPAG